jgi:hypothetical protein
MFNPILDHWYETHWKDIPNFPKIHMSTLSNDSNLLSLVENLEQYVNYVQAFDPA